MKMEERIERLEAIWLSCNDGMAVTPAGEYMTKEREFRQKAREEGFSRKEIEAYLDGEDEL